MTDREKLEKIVLEYIQKSGWLTPPELVDHLIAHGVTVRPTADLTGKCGSCVHAKPVVEYCGSQCYVSCGHPERVFKNATQHIRQRTCRACKLYTAPSP